MNSFFSDVLALPFLVIFFAICGVAIIFGYYYFEKRKYSWSKPLPINEMINPPEYRCPQCQSVMIPSYVCFYQGLVWNDPHGGEDSKWQATPLKNTMPSIFSPTSTFYTDEKPKSGVNQSWNCPHCKLLMVDHSFLVKM